MASLASLNLAERKKSVEHRDEPSSGENSAFEFEEMT